jgi:prepilin-type processing-associated H-X9-DG protein
MVLNGEPSNSWGYPSRPYWDTRLLSYLGVHDWDGKPSSLGENILSNFFCQTHRKIAEQKDIEFPRSYRINGWITGLDDWLEGGIDAPNTTKMSKIRQSSSTILFVEVSDVGIFDDLNGWACRGTYDITPAHFVKEGEPEVNGNPWKLPAMYGSSNFGFADGHVQKIVKVQFTFDEERDAIPGVIFKP